jgi:hypothetical protein
MAKQVFIRTPSGPVTSANFLESIKPHFHDRLLQASQQLIATGQLQGFEATQLENGDWALALEHDEKRTDFVLYVSEVEVEAESEVVVHGSTPKKSQSELVIVDLAGEKEKAGGIHPGYWSVDWYSAQVDPLVRPKFLAAIQAIRINKPSRSYRRNGDGTYTIAIDDDGTPREMHIYCLARWKT